MSKLMDPGAGEKDRATRKKKRMTMTNVVLGARQYNNAISSCFEGKLAHATIYSRALTQAEITQNYNYLKGYLRRERGISLS